MGRTLVASDAFASTTQEDLASNWTQLTPSTSIMSKASGVVYDRHANNGACRWNANAFANDQYSKLTVTVLTDLNDPSNYIGVIARASTGVDAARDFYFMRVCADGDWLTELGKIVDGTTTILYSEDIVSWAVTDTIEIECEGTTIRGMRNGALINANFAVTDSALASGSAGILGDGIDATGPTVGDNWEGGDITADGLGRLILSSPA